MRHVGTISFLVLCSCAPPTTAFLLSVSRPAAAGLGRSAQTLTMVGSTSADVRIQKDVVVIGGGLAGLSTALELAKRGRQVTVVSRNRAEAAAEAAGGMIAPQAERLESGTYLDLCLSSRAMYAEWVRSIEAIAGMGGGKENGKGGERERAETHFWSSGGFMSPAFEGDAVHTWSPPPEGGQAHWVDRDQVRCRRLFCDSLVAADWARGRNVFGSTSFNHVCNNATPSCHPPPHALSRAQHHQHSCAG